MKTSTKINMSSNNNTKSCLVNPAKIILVLTMVCVIYLNGMSQNQFGIEAVSTITGSGHGTQYSPRIFYKHQKSTISIGSIIQKQKMHLSGWQAEYQYHLSGNNKGEASERYELFCFINSIYNNGYLSSNEIKKEEMLSSDKSNSYINFKYKTVENYIGFGLKLKLINNLWWSNAVGFGGYYSFENNNNMYHEQQSVSLLLRTGLSFHFENNR